MERRLKLPRVKIVRRKGKAYYYYRSRDGLVALPDPSDMEAFSQAYGRLQGATQREPVARTVGALWAAYRASTQYSEKAPATQRTYRYTVQAVWKRVEKAPAASITPEHAQRLVDTLSPGTGAMVVRVMSMLWRWGRKRGWCKTDPWADVDTAKGGEHEPWPEHVLTAALQSEDDAFRRAVHLHYYSGQRTGDVCRFTRANVRDGQFRLRQQKTGKELTFPIHKNAEIDQSGMMLLANRHGKAMTPTAFRAWCKRFGARYGAHLVPHGLRKNAVIALLEAGCTVAEVSAITGMSIQMVEHYGRKRNNNVIAIAAVGKWERRG